jgi:8-oxo-dGTP diphosphatase
MSESRRYPARPLVGIGVIVWRGDEVLLIRRGRPPAAGEWSFPGGAQRVGETAEQAARRELFEETGLSVGALQLAGHVDSIHRDADGKIEYHYTILDFCARYAGGEPHAGGDAADIAWAHRDRLDAFTLWSDAKRLLTTSQALMK